MCTIFKFSFLFIVISMDSIVFIQSSKLVDIETISKVHPGRSKTYMGNVYGARSCGGEGQFIQWRLEGCKTTDSTCTYPADGQTHHGEFIFVPSRNVEQLVLKQVSSIKGSKLLRVEETPLQNSKVFGGIEQTIHLTGRIAQEHKGKMITTQSMLYRAHDKGVEMCAQADFIMV